MNAPRLARGAMLASALAAAPATTAAEVSFPTRPNRLIAPSARGGPVDVIGKVISSAGLEQT